MKNKGNNEKGGKLHITSEFLSYLFRHESPYFHSLSRLLLILLLSSISLSASISFFLIISSISSFSFTLSSYSLFICNITFSCVPPNNSAKWSRYSSIFILSLIISVFFFLYLYISMPPPRSLYFVSVLLPLSHVSSSVPYTIPCILSFFSHNLPC